MEAENAQESEKTGYGTNPVSSPARGIHPKGCDVLQGSAGRKAIEAYLHGSAEIKDVVNTFYHI
jgi:hypothetical protein